MPIADDIERACEMIRHGRNMLIISADRGGFCHPDSYAAVMIRKAIADVAKTLDRLEANTPADITRGAA
jgi:hypothetical protein